MKTYLSEKLVWILGTILCTTVIGYIIIKIEGSYVVIYGYDIIASIIGGIRIMSYMVGSLVVVRLWDR